MTYPETLDYLFSRLPMFQRIGPAAYKANLETSKAILGLLNNPQDSFQSVHIAGTNGKGSVSSLLASVLQESGLKVGLFTSPHLKDFRERIRINGEMIPEGYVTGFVADHKGDFERLAPSFFEMTVGLAFDFFRNEKIDLGIIEAGMGGRLDSTNLLSPLLSVITNISFDHMQFLGDTLKAIATEKAGIIKPGIPVLIGETHPDTCSLFEEKALAAGSEIVFADTLFSLSRWEITQEGETIHTDVSKSGKRWLQDIESPLTGNYQKKNLITLCAACDMLRDQGLAITGDSIRRGILRVKKNTGFTGRWQILSHDPLTVCDTGHNEAGLQEVIAQIAETPHLRLHFVFGMVNDKEIDAVLRMLPSDAQYYFCKADIPRGLDADKLRLKAMQFGLKGSSYPSVRAAVTGAKKAAGSKDLIFIGGSTFVVAEAVLNNPFTLR